MLTLTLRRLERDGIVTRTVYPQIPPRVEYELTPLGSSSVGVVEALADWALEHYPAIEESRARFDEAHPANVVA
jgi:DNA-binding HxlR family transcriptional regulator